jgi:hypothetical protein
MEKWNAYIKEQIRLAELRRAKTPGLGKKVKIVRGKYTGQSGEIFWEGENKFKRNVERFGVKTENGSRVFVDGNQVEVILEWA